MASDGHDPAGAGPPHPTPGARPPVLGREAVMPLLVAASPSFATTWAELEHDPVHRNADGTRLHHLDAGVFADHLVALHLGGHDEEVRAVLAVVERLHLEGDAYVRELATIGLLEDVQVTVAADAEAYARLEAALGPETARWWQALLASWEGRAPSVTPERPAER